jgi:hypothetical protein
VIAATGQIWGYHLLRHANLNGDDLVDFSAIGQDGILALMVASHVIAAKVVVGLACNNDQAGTEDVLLSSI